MNIRIEAVQGGEIQLSSALPFSLQQLRIPESVSYGAVGPFGHVLLQQLEGEGISLLYHTFYFNEREEIIYSSEEPAIRLQIILRNSYYYDSRHLGPGVLHERGISLNYVPYIATSFRLRPEELYSHLTIFYQKRHLLPLQNSVPGLNSFIAKTTIDQAAYFTHSYAIADTAILGVVDNILECPYQGHLRGHYIGHLCIELLLLALVRMTTSNPAAGIIGENDIGYVYQARDLVSKEMGGDISLSSLAERTGVSVYKLNHGFKSIYGIGIAEYLMETRMKKAHSVLTDTDMSVGIVAKECGYSHPHAFSLAFKKHFGYTPAFVQRSARSHGGHL